VKSADANASSPAVPPQGRLAQRRRTRNAIVAAAKQLISEGVTPSIDDVAAAADVSRRTIYLYFPTVDRLLLDATAGLLTEATVDEALHSDRDGDDVSARVDRLARALVRAAPEALPLGRKIIKLTVDGPPEEGIRRGYRRVEWIERAVAPIRDQLTEQHYQRLVSALSIVLGWEAMIVLRDVRGLDATREEEVLRWTARMLVEAAVSEADERAADRKTT
jgi:AcrR family transcriptional regulator